MRTCRIILLAFCLLAPAGCNKGGPEVVPVSGVVYVDGKPQPGLHVVFQPLGSKENPEPGRGSHGITDASGKFTLEYDGTKPGAVVGKHRVAIATVLEGEGQNYSEETGSPDGVVPMPGKREMIPIQYNDQTTLSFDVPSGGTDQAEFRLYVKTKAP
jgi:hypothetical protein